MENKLIPCLVHFLILYITNANISHAHYILYISNTREFNACISMVKITIVPQIFPFTSFTIIMKGIFVNK